LRTAASPVEDTDLAIRGDSQKVVTRSRPGAAVEVPVADVQIADDEDRFVLFDTATLSYFTKQSRLSTSAALLHAYLSALPVQPAFGLY
jgi:hypothetical protein